LELQAVKEVVEASDGVSFYNRVKRAQQTLIVVG